MFSVVETSVISFLQDDRLTEHHGYTVVTSLITERCIHMVNFHFLAKLPMTSMNDFHRSHCWISSLITNDKRGSGIYRKHHITLTQVLLVHTVHTTLQPSVTQINTQGNINSSSPSSRVGH